LVIYLRRTHPAPSSSLFPYTTLFRSIGGVVYTAPETQVTLENADPTNNRIDLIVANSNSTITVITGTPSDNPEKPSYDPETQVEDRKSTRLNSSHVKISYAVFCLKKK